MHGAANSGFGRFGGLSTLRAAMALRVKMLMHDGFNKMHNVLDLNHPCREQLITRFDSVCQSLATKLIKRTGKLHTAQQQ